MYVCAVGVGQRTVGWEKEGLVVVLGGGVVVESVLRLMTVY